MIYFLNYHESWFVIIKIRDPTISPFLMMAIMSHDITINLSMHNFIQEFTRIYTKLSFIQLWSGIITISPKVKQNIRHSYVRYAWLHQFVWYHYIILFSPFDINKKKIQSLTGVEEDCCVNNGEHFSAFFSWITSVSMRKVASWMEWS